MDIGKYLAKPDKSIKEHVDDLLYALEQLNNFGYIPTKYIYDMIKIACIYHDHGKANTEFQKRVRLLKKGFDESREVAHNVLSLYFLPYQIFEQEEDYYKVANAILNHHDYCDTLEILQDQNKKELIHELLDEFKEEIEKITKRRIKKIKEIIKEKEAILIKGFLHKCDYSASAGMKVEYANDFLENKLEKLGYEWNELQVFCKENTNHNIIAVAQTGLGKTEGGLLWIGNHKGFFILPIRTAINAIYDRIRIEILHNENLEERVALLHSEALEYYRENINESDMDIVDYYEKGKKLSMPLTVCTMDQLFDFVFKYNGCELKLATLSYSKVVLDEIQMYNPELLAYLICGIKKVNELGGKVAVVTATLPPFVRSEIIEALGSDVKEGTFIGDGEKYSTKRHNVQVLKEAINVELISEKFRENEKKKRSNKVLIVCNTIKKAQDIYIQLKKVFTGEMVELNLLHARFLKKDRRDKEKNILKFGKTYGLDEKIDHQSGIWITTSIVEASLDIDFDYLFTELKDLASLFQRFGRCNRKGVKQIDEVNCYVFTETELGKNIDRYIYQLSKEAIEGVEGILDENKKLNLINEYFTTEKVRKSDYYDTYGRVKEQMENMPIYEWNKNDINLRNILSANIIPSPVYMENEEYIKECVDKISLEKDKVLKAKLRDEIRNYILPVPNYIIQEKQKVICESINISRYEKIPVLECKYDIELGFQKIDYTTYIRETNIM